MTAKTLLFSNPTFHPGFNLTTRLGTKWASERNARIDLGGGHTTYVANLHTIDRPFNELEDKDLVFEHDPACRTVEGLAKVMKEVYPEFEVTDMVTLVTFYLDFKKPVVGDAVYHPDMAPVQVGNIEEAIELNDNFWEITYGETWPDGTHRRYRSMVHETQYDRHIPNGEPGGTHGWFVTDGVRL